MPRVVDANGVIYALEGSDLTKALAAGQVKLAETVAVETDSGRSSLGPDMTSAQSRLVGATGFVNPDEARAQREEAWREEYYGGQNLKAGVEGFASGLTLGASDVALDALGADTANRAAYNPNVRLGTELTGMLAAAVATGGTGAGAGASRLGMLLAKTPAGAVTKAATGMGARIGGVKGLAAGAALEGAAYSAGQTASQLLITDEPLSAEAVFAEIGKNAAFGAGAGALGGAVVGGLGKGWGKLKAARASAPIVDIASTEGKAVSKGMADAVTEIDAVADDLIRQADEAAKFSPLEPTPGVIDEAGSSIPQPGGPPPVQPFEMPPDVAPTNPPMALSVDDARPAGGTQGGKWYTDEAGNGWFGKPNGGDADRVHAEDLANKLYRTFGVAAPETHVMPTADGVATVFSKELPGSPRTLADLADTDLRDNFVVDAWLGNWDVIGQDADNVLVDAAGKAQRIDNGGVFWWRAQGGKKAFDDIDVEELISMRDAGRPSAEVFGTLTDDELYQQTSRFLDMYSAKRGMVEELVVGSGLSPKLQDELASTLHNRVGAIREFRDMLGQKLAKPVASPKTVKLDPYEAAAQKRFAAPAKVTPEMHDAAEIYTGDWYDQINKYLRKGVMPTGGQVADQPIDDVIKNLDELIEQSPIPDNLSVYRRINMDDVAQYKVGETVTDEAYTSTTVDPTVLAGFTNDMAGNTPVTLKIELPAGAKGLYVNKVVKGTPSERELLLPRGLTYRIMGAETDEAGKLVVRARVEGTPLAELKRTQAAVREAFGSHRITPAVFNKLLSEPADVAATKLKLLDEYFEAAKKLAGDNPEAMGRFESATKAIGETADVATGGIKLGEVAMGLGLWEAGDRIDGPVGTIAQVVGAAQLAKTGGSAVSRKGGGWLRKAAKGATKVAGGRLASKMLPGYGGAGSMAAFGVGSRAFGSLFDTVIGQRAIAGVTHNSLDRVGKAFGKIGRAVGTAKPHITGPALIRSARFGYGPDAEKPTPPGLHAAFKDRQAELAAFAANPTAGQQAIHDELAEVRKVQPYVADELEMLAVKTNMYLYDQMPKDPGTMNRLGESTWRPSEYEIRAWGECCKGALAPVDTFEDALGGRITPKAAHAVRYLYPNLYGRMQQNLAERAPELRSTLTLQERTRLSILFDTPLDSTMRPDFRGFIAEQHAMRNERDAQAAQTNKPNGATANPAPLTGAQILIA